MELIEVINKITPEMLEDILKRNKIDWAKIKGLIERYKIIVNKVLWKK